jgi:vancomycin resistance protein VanW
MKLPAPGVAAGSIALAAAAGVLTAAMGWAAVHREPEVVLARYVTRLDGRTRNQAHNVRLAARSVHGRWLQPGETFSFNQAVGSWSSESAYRRAPVSYDGELVPSWGGGICQASTTLYNAALLAGLHVAERHRHRWAPGYVAPGRDAAVAYSGIDLRLRNDHPWPVRLEAETRGALVEFRVVGRGRPDASWAIRQQVLAVAEPANVHRTWEPVAARGSRRRVRNPGKPGYRVLTYRLRLEQGRETARELLSDDHYPAMNRLLLED